MTLGRSRSAIWSRKLRRRSSSTLVRMPSCMACWTPWVQPAAMALGDLVLGGAGPGCDGLEGAVRRAVSEKPAVPAAWAGSWVISRTPVGVEVTALAVLPAQEAGVLSAVPAGAHRESSLRVNFGYKPSFARISFNCWRRPLGRSRLTRYSINSLASCQVHGGKS